MRKICRVVPVIAELDYEQVSDNVIKISLGELDKKQGQSLLVEMILTPRPEGKFRLSQAEFAFDIPGENVFQEKVREDIVVDFSADQSHNKKINPKVMNIVERVSAYDLQTRALSHAAGGDIPGATQKLKAAATRLLDLGEKELANAALEEAENLELEGAMSSAGTKKLRYETRKLTQKLF